MECDPDDLIGTAEAAQILGLDYRTVPRLVQRGQLAAVRRRGTGRTAAYEFRRDDVVALARRRQAAYEAKARHIANGLKAS